ncbi:MAG TPA: cobalamin-binding protein [Candidatus Acidoferrales bacterium]|nr:cobalamin-binding protein [Candidatus Acidoferrales bacterium]
MSLGIKLGAILLLTSITVPCFASRTGKDELGRSVDVPDHPHRVVCLVPSVVDIVYSLGAGEYVVAISDFTKYPKEALQKPSIGLPLNPSMETILALHPDLVLGSGDMNTLESTGHLQRLGIPVFIVDPHGIEGIYASILRLGWALNREPDANTLVARLRTRVDAVKARVSGKPKVRVLMAIWYDPVMTIGKRAFISELIDAAGGRSVTDDIAQEWPEVSLETIVTRQPDALLLMSGSNNTLEELKTRPGWEHLKAVREGRVYYTDERIQYPSPIAFDVLEDLAKQFHP